jgi:phenylalanyl-tRNA synthetase beta subunit
MIWRVDATYFPGRAAKIFYRPRKGTEAREPKPLLEDPVVIDTAASKSASSAPLPQTSTKPPSESKAASVLASVTDTIKSVLPTSTKASTTTKPKEGSSESTHPARADGAIEIGSLGILHPSVLASFEIPYPCSALEFDLAPFVKEERPVWA